MLEVSTRLDNVPIVRSETHAVGSFTGFEMRAHSLQSDAPKSQARLTSPVDYNIFDIIRRGLATVAASGYAGAAAAVVAAAAVESGADSALLAGGDGTGASADPISTK
jgi:hypothetical protein